MKRLSSLRKKRNKLKPLRFDYSAAKRTRETSSFSPDLGPTAAWNRAHRVDALRLELLPSSGGE